MDNPSQALGTAHRTVLNIEDSAANVLLVEELIGRRRDLKVITAMTGKQGIELACARQPDVILLDINLPDIDGMEVLKILLGTAQTAHIPVIALSSNAFPEQIEKGMRAGFFAYLTKPFKIDALMENIDEALRFSSLRPTRSDGSPLEP